MSKFSHGCSSLSLLLLFLLVLPRSPAADQPAYTPGDLILLNCGASSNLTDISSRLWQTDDQSTYVPEKAARLSLASAASHMHPSVPDLVPYQTARVFSSPFRYSFPVAAGRKFIRLYFYPDTFSGFDSSQSFFSVSANGFTLLSNFSAFLNAPKSNPSFIKEFIINVEGNPRLDLTFSPNPSSFAFINGIEIVSLPDDLYFRGWPIKFVPGQLYYLQNDTALETLYRLNVGGADVQIQDDSGMFRYWTQDDDYILGADFGYTPYDEDHKIQYTKETPACSAPKVVYRTSRTMANTSISLEWAFPVDSGFYYLLRFHFCEIQLEVTKQNERVFTISIDHETAEIDADVIFWTGGTGIPVFRDYIKWIPKYHGHHGKKDMRLSLSPYNEGMPKYSNALLNGLEIFKLSDSKRSLAAANPEPVIANSPPLAPENKKNGSSSVVYSAVGSVICVLAVVAAVSFLIFSWRWKVKDPIINYEVIKDTKSDVSSRYSFKGIKVPRETEKTSLPH